VEGRGEVGRNATPASNPSPPSSAADIEMRQWWVVRKVAGRRRGAPSQRQNCTRADRSETAYEENTRLGKYRGSAATVEQQVKEARDHVSTRAVHVVPLQPATNSPPHGCSSTVCRPFPPVKPRWRNAPGMPLFAAGAPQKAHTLRQAACRSLRFRFVAARAQ